MENLNKLFTEEQVENVSEKILLNLKERIKDQIADSFYKETHNYLHEHYDNFKNGLKQDLIKEITDEYISNPANYQFRALRDRLFEENKDAILPALTDQVIKQSMEKILYEYTHTNAQFSWKWKEGIANLIIKNWDLFKDDERINNVFRREKENLEAKMVELKKRIAYFSEEN
jgi:hypothetical protein